jgi:hypothetical protein
LRNRKEFNKNRRAVMIAISAYSDIATIITEAALELTRFRNLEDPHQELGFLEKIQRGIAVLNLLQEGQRKFSDPKVSIGTIDFDHGKMFEVAHLWMAKNAPRVKAARYVLEKMLLVSGRQRLSGQELENAIDTLQEIADLYLTPRKV